MTPRAAWLGLLGTGLAAVLAGLSSQVHALLLPDLAGAIGQSTASTSWVIGAGVAGEVAAVLVAAQLGRVVGTRRLLAAGALLGALGAILALSSDSLPLLVLARTISGLGFGMLPVLMMGWSLRAFPHDSRGLPLMLFALASSVPAALAASVAGALVLGFGGRGGLLFDAAWALPVALLGWRLVPAEPVNLTLLRDWDMAGLVLLAGAATCLMLALQQGEARFWLETAWMAPLVAAGLALSGLALIRLATAATPWIDLRLLRLPTFRLAIAEALSLRFGLMLAAFAVPQALLRLQGFRPEQVGEATLWLGLGQLLGFPLAWAWIRLGDARQPLALGLLLFLGSAVLAAELTPAWQGEEFAPSLLLAGLGQGLFLTAILAFAVAEVTPAGGPTAAALFNLSRVLAQTGATAGLGLLLRLRENFHSAILVEQLSADDRGFTAQLAELTRGYAAASADSAAAAGAALGAVAQRTALQAYVLAFADVFLGIAAVMAAFLLLVPLLPRLRR